MNTALNSLNSKFQSPIVYCMRRRESIRQTENNESGSLICIQRVLTSNKLCLWNTNLSRETSIDLQIIVVYKR